MVSSRTMFINILVRHTMTITTAINNPLRTRQRIFNLALLSRMFRVSVTFPILNIFTVNTMPQNMALTIQISLNRVNFATQMERYQNRTQRTSTGRIMSMFRFPQTLIQTIRIQMLLQIIRRRTITLTSMIRQHITISPLVHNNGTIVANDSNRVRTMDIIISITRRHITNILHIVRVRTQIRTSRLISHMNMVRVMMMLIPSILRLDTMRTTNRAQRAIPSRTNPIRILTIITINRDTMKNTSTFVTTLIMQFNRANLTAFSRPTVRANVNRTSPTGNLQRRTNITTNSRQINRRRITNLRFNIRHTRFRHDTNHKGQTQHFTITHTSQRSTQAVNTTATVRFRPRRHINIGTRASNTLNRAKFGPARGALTPLSIIVNILRTVTIRMMVTDIRIGT